MKIQRILLIFSVLLLTAIIGEMGKGKTACMTFLAKHFSKMGYNIFANYNLKDINFTHVMSTADIDNVKFGKAFYDEFWLWLDSRCSTFDEANKQISDILLKSRKRGYDITYTLQGFYQIDKRIRNVTDYILVPASYLYCDGELRTVEQSYLYPFDMKPYIENIVINVDICKPSGEYELEKVDDFSFWLKDVINAYDTTEEIESIKTPLQKGIYVENGFTQHMKAMLPGAEIIQSPNSGHYINSLDVEILINKKLHLIDVTTIQKRKTKEYEYFYIDRREKDFKKSIEISELRKAEIWTAYRFLNEWYFINMKEKEFVEIVKNKEMINIRDVKKITLNTEEFVDEVKNE